MLVRLLRLAHREPAPVVQLPEPQAPPDPKAELLAAANRDPDYLRLRANRLLASGDLDMGLFCREKAAELTGDDPHYRWELMWTRIEAGDTPDPAAIREGLRTMRLGGEHVSNSICVPRVLGAHVEAMKTINRINVKAQAGSATTQRFRDELVLYLLDNPACGPVVEVGIFHGGTTALFAYVGAVTGRRVFGVDHAQCWLDEAKAGCDRYGLEADFFLGDSAKFLSSGCLKERPDLVFIDSDHSYRTTLRELEDFHASPHLPRAIAMHDFSYRIIGHMDFSECEKTNPIAVDHALFDFCNRRLPQVCKDRRPTVKRFGAFAGDGTTTTRDNPGTTQKDFIEDYGCEGMLLLYP